MRFRYRSASIIILVFFFLSCSTKTDVNDSSIGHDYSEVSSMTIVFNNCLIQKEQNYLLYFYSSYCGHCKEIKDSVIEFALRKIVPFYFVIFDSTVPIFNDIEATIGASKIEEIGILGTPSLINIFEGSVRLNIAGSSKIMELINSYLYK